MEGSCYFTIENGEIIPASGRAENPDLTIDTPFEVWMDIITGKAEGAQTLMEGKYKVAGDTNLLLNISQYFGQTAV
ncbi:MAG: SCP2 sterol-binding domain-containing protein [Deltaproteobacteria bacterium]|nr:SCP2 sterol-binding domain-containing protein [Deltaproteobacteria bacterium]